MHCSTAFLCSSKAKAFDQKLSKVKVFKVSDAVACRKVKVVLCLKPKPLATLV